MEFMEEPVKVLKVAKTIDVPEKKSESNPIAENNISSILGSSTYEESLSIISVDKKDKYKIVKTLGRGGMKTVFKAKDEVTGRNVAMAVILDADRRKDDALRFIQEAKITANLEHPNIVPVHEIGVNSFGEPYFTMKLVGGEDLSFIIEKLSQKNREYRARFTLLDRLEIFRKICDAVDFAHSRGVIHLDLKPENILVGEFGEVLVLDWGLAKVLTPLSRQASNHVLDFSPPPDKFMSVADSTIDGMAKGTPGYMSPEQAAGRNSIKDERTDIYTLGGILYSLLTFRKPIEGDDLEKVLVKTIRGRILPPRMKTPKIPIPKALEAVAMKAMAKKPANRYQSVTELKKDIDSFITGFATKAEGAGFFTHLFLLAKRRRATATIFILLLLSCLSIVGTWGWYRLKEHSTWENPRLISPAQEIQFSKEWFVKSGNWKLKNGWLAAEKGRELQHLLYFNEPFSGNVAIEFEVYLNNENSEGEGGELGAILLADASDNERYYISIGTKFSPYNRIMRGDNMLGSESFTLEKGKTYGVRVEKDDEWINLYIDGHLRLATQDIFNLKGGFIGFHTYGTGKMFRGIKVCSKEAPELVSPLVEGDAFYNKSRARSGAMRINYLEDALELYGKVYESHFGKELGRKALMKIAFINAELGRYDDAAKALKAFKTERPSFQELVFEADLWFSAGKYRLALDSYIRASNEFPGKKETVASSLREKLKSYEKMEISPNLLKEYMKLCEEK